MEPIRWKKLISPWATLELYSPTHFFTIIGQPAVHKDGPLAFLSTCLTAIYSAAAPLEPLQLHGAFLQWFVVLVVDNVNTFSVWQVMRDWQASLEAPSLASSIISPTRLPKNSLTRFFFGHNFTHSLTHSLFSVLSDSTRCVGCNNSGIFVRFVAGSSSAQATIAIATETTTITIEQE